MRVALVACVALACGKGETTPKKHDAGVPREAAVVVTLEPLALGLPDLEAYRWRKRGGHPAFRVARTAEAKEDWATVVTTTKQALAADPSHLEASWLLAAALGRLGKHEEILAPLVAAVSGDFGKWGLASLELPALQSFLATPTGQAWKARVEADRVTYVGALARSLLVTADGDVFAFDARANKWHRLTRSYGAVVGAMRVPAANKILYVTRQGAKGKRTFAVGYVDLVRGRTSKPIELGTTKPIVVGYQPKSPNLGVWISFDAKKTWQRIDETNKLVALPPKTPKPPGAILEVRGKKAKRRSLPLENVVADWDQHGLASAIRIGKSNRVVSVPSPGLIDGNSATWSADGARLAFVAQLSDECVPGSISSAAFVADAATGKWQELERAAKGIAVVWVGDHELAVAGDSGVVIYNLDTATNAKVDGAEGLVAPKLRPKCTAQEPEPPDLDDDVIDDASVESDVKNP